MNFMNPRSLVLAGALACFLTAQAGDIPARPDALEGKEVEVFVYNVADHKDAYNEVGSQGISYTAGVPPVAMAMLIADGTYDTAKMVNVEELDPKPLFALLDRIGLPTRVKDEAGDRSWAEV